MTKEENGNYAINFQFEKYTFYTKVFENGRKIIFQFNKGEPDYRIKNTVRVFVRCDENGDHYYEDDLVVLSFDNNYEGYCYFREATSEEIELINNPVLPI